MFFGVELKWKEKSVVKFQFKKRLNDFLKLP